MGIAKVTDNTKGIAAIILLAATVALLSVFARYLDTGFTIFQQVYLRLFVALLLVVAVFYKHIRWRVVAKIPLKEWGVLAFRGLTGYAIGVTLLTQAATMTAISNVTFVAALPLVPLLGFIVLKEKVTWWKLVFVLGAFFGVVVITTNGLSLVSWDAGSLVALSATLGMAFSYIARKWHGPALNNQEITTLTFVFGFGFVLLLSLGIDQSAPTTEAVWSLWPVLLIAGAFSALKLTLANYGFQKIGAVQGGNLLTLEGAWGIVFGLLFYHEVPTWHGLVGGFIIVACAIGMNVYANHAHAKIATSLDGGHVHSLEKPRHRLFGRFF